MRAGIVVNVTREDRLRLEAIGADRSAPQKHVWRAKVILAAADECGTGRRGSWRRASKGWRATRRASLVRLRVLVGVRYLEHETDPVMIRERGFEGIHEAMRILPLYHARSVEHIKKRELVTTDLQLLAASGLRRPARRHHVWHHHHRFCGHCLNCPLTKGRRHPDLVEVTKLAPPFVAKCRQLPYPYPYLVLRARKGSCVEVQEAMDGIGVD